MNARVDFIKTAGLAYCIENVARVIEGIVPDRHVLTVEVRRGE